MGSWSSGLAWYESERYAVDPGLPPSLSLAPLPLALSLALGKGNVHLELDGLLEDGRAAGRFVLGPEGGLGDHTVTERGDLRGGETEKKQRDRQTYEAGEVRGANVSIRRQRVRVRRGETEWAVLVKAAWAINITRVSDSQIKKDEKVIRWEKEVRQCGREFPAAGTPVRAMLY